MENTTAENFGIYIELDCLLDTRFGTLAELNEDLSLAVLEDGYVLRDEENFKGIKQEHFRELYKLRDNQTLAKSPVTYCARFITDLIKEFKEKTANTPMMSKVNIVINTYPYRLTEHDVQKLLALFVKQTNKLASIEIVYKTIKEVTPAYCRDNFDCMFIYDYNAWLEYHVTNRNLGKVTLREITLYAPRIYFNRKPTNEEAIKFKREGIEPFSIIEEFASPVIDLQLQDIVMFSIDFELFVGKKA